MFALTDQQIEQAGVILDTMKKSRDDFRKSFHALANTVETMTGVSPKTVKKK